MTFLKFSFLFCLIAAVLQMPSFGQNSSISVMSYNLRLDTDADGVNRWDNRKERVASLIQLFEPDFIGIQEGLLHQLQYLDKELDGYRRIGVGRDDGENAGEFSALYYNSARVELAEGTSRTLWLSETPEEPGSKSWDAALPRILTFGKFKDTATGNDFFVFNTHFDHVGQQAREESAKLILNTIRETAGDLPVLLTGDFNVTEDNAAYEVLTGSESGLKDTFYESEIPHTGPHFTFEGFEVHSSDNPRRIDFIFTSDRVTVRKHAIPSLFKNGFYPSDHLPVYAEVEL